MFAFRSQLAFQVNPDDHGEVPMRILIAPQSLKGSLTAAEAGQAIAQGVQAVYPKAAIEIVPVADGGEGTVQALIDATEGKIIQQTVTGPLGEHVPAFFGMMGDGRTAAIEMAASAGRRHDPPAWAIRAG